MNGHRAPAPALLRRGRLRLAGLSLLVMGAILYAAGFATARLLLDEQEAALRRELQTVAGTLHDTLKPSLPPSPLPSPALAAALPGLCLVDQPCAAANALIERHAISATDPTRFRLRIFTPSGQLLAASPEAVGASGENSHPSKQRPSANGERRLSTTIHLHRAHGRAQQSWGYLQISRSLAPLDAEAKRLWWLGHGVFVLAMAGMSVASWWLAGLAMAPLLEAYRRQEQFSADVAHELRAPLANLMALLETERDAVGSPLTGPARAGCDGSTLERILTQGRRLQQLITDLLLLASLDGPTERSRLTVFNLAVVCADVMEDFGEIAAATDVKLQPSLIAGDAYVFGVESELSRLLINLLTNAIENSPPGGTVWVRLDRSGREIRLSVQDEGPGVPLAAQSRIFERFTRLDLGRSRSQGGHGAGTCHRPGHRTTPQGTDQRGHTFQRGGDFYPDADWTQADELMES